MMMMESASQFNGNPSSSSYLDNYTDATEAPAKKKSRGQPATAGGLKLIRGRNKLYQTSKPSAAIVEDYSFLDEPVIDSISFEDNFCNSSSTNNMFKINPQV